MSLSTAHHDLPTGLFQPRNHPFFRYLTVKVISTFELSRRQPRSRMTGEFLRKSGHRRGG